MPVSSARNENNLLTSAKCHLLNIVVNVLGFREMRFKNQNFLEDIYSASVPKFKYPKELNWSIHLEGKGTISSWYVTLKYDWETSS